MPGPGPLRLLAATALALALAVDLAGCKTPEEKESERLMPAVDALVATLPAGDPKDFVRTHGYLDALDKLERALRDGPHPPAGTPAALKLLPTAAWAQAARAENTRLQEAFQKALEDVEQKAHAALVAAVAGGPTRDASDLPAALARSETWPILLWHGIGTERRFDEDQQNLPYPERRALDPDKRFIVGYVQRVDGEGVRLSVESVTAEQKVAIVALYLMPSRSSLGVFTVKGEMATLPNPVPVPGTILPGGKPPLIESLLPRP